MEILMRVEILLKKIYNLQLVHYKSLFLVSCTII